MAGDEMRMITELRTTFPWVDKIYGEHKSSNFGELLPAHFMGELVADLCKLDSDTIGLFVAIVDKHYTSGSDDTRSIVYTGFLECLFGRPECNRVIGLLTRQLLREFESID